MLSGYVISIVGIIVLSVLINIIMPDGNMSKYINNVFALIIVFVIISPIPALLNYDMDLDQILTNANAEIDNNFIYVINSQTIDQLESMLEVLIEREGYENIEVVATANIFDTPMNIQKITIDLKRIVINSDASHINKYSKIKEIVLNNILIKEEDVVFYGWK